MTPNCTQQEQGSGKDMVEEKWIDVEKDEIIWKQVIFFIYLHYGAAFGIYYVLSNSICWQTWVWTYLLIFVTTEGIGVGVHRLWAHRAFKAKLPLRILLAFYHTLALQKDIYDWCRDHRLHHKYSDTISDPHNARRGFFYSHIGWLMMKKKNSVISKGRTMDLSDLEADPVVMLQRKYYYVLWAPLVGVVMPNFVPWYFWNENLEFAWCCTLLRLSITLHFVGLVNSAAHIFGTRPYDKSIKPTQNVMLSYITHGEGFHNYHHAFPWDYKSSELGSYNGNLNTAFIDLMAKIGWAYDLKTASANVIQKRIDRLGDGTWKLRQGSPVWGWGDKDMVKADLSMDKDVSPY